MHTFYPPRLPAWELGHSGQSANGESRPRDPFPCTKVRRYQQYFCQEPSLFSKPRSQPLSAMLVVPFDQVPPKSGSHSSTQGDLDRRGSYGHATVDSVDNTGVEDMELGDCASSFLVSIPLALLPGRPGQVGVAPQPEVSVGDDHGGLYPKVPEWIQGAVTYHCPQLLQQEFARWQSGESVTGEHGPVDPLRMVELNQVMALSHSYPLVDIGSTAISFRGQVTEARNADIQYQLKGLVEEFFSGRSTEAHHRRILLKAEAARQLKFVRCDDRCYFWLALWLARETCIQTVFMVQVEYLQPEQREERVIPNHYLLLIPSAGHQGALLSKGSSVLARGGQLNHQLVDSLAMAGVLLVDPSTQTLIPVNQGNIARHMAMVAHIYSFQNHGDIAISPVEAINKSTPVTGAQRQAIRNKVKTLLPLAVLLSARENTQYLNYLRGVMDKLKLTPARAWPDKIRETASWTRSVLYCLKKLYSVSGKIQRFLPEDERPNDFDIIACYRTDTEEYREALKNQANRYLALGKSANDCLERMGSYGFGGGAHWSGVWDMRCQPYLIPDIPQVPVQLRNTTNWPLWGEAGLQILGVDLPSVPTTLKQYLEKLMKTPRRCSEHLHSGVASDLCFSLWQDREEIKDSIKKSRPYMQPLTRHLIHVCQASVPAHLQKTDCNWQPLDSLRVCKPESACYRQAMQLFLSSARDAIELADRLTRRTCRTVSQAKQQDLRAVAMPKQLAARFGQWCPKAVQELMGQFGIAEPPPLVSLVQHAQQLFDTVYSHEPDTALTSLGYRLRGNAHVRRYMKRYRESWDDRGVNLYQQVIILWDMTKNHLPDKIHQAMPETVKQRLALDGQQNPGIE